MGDGDALRTTKSTCQLPVSALSAECKFRDIVLIAKQVEFVKYADGDYASIQIVNGTTISPVNKKDKVVKLSTKLPSESFFYTNGEQF